MNSTILQAGGGLSARLQPFPGGLRLEYGQVVGGSFWPNTDAVGRPQQQTIYGPYHDASGWSPLVWALVQAKRPARTRSEALDRALIEVERRAGVDLKKTMQIRHKDGEDWLDIARLIRTTAPRLSTGTLQKFLQLVYPPVVRNAAADALKVQVG